MSGFGLRNLYWSPQTRQEMPQLPIQNILLHVATTRAGYCPDVSLKYPLMSLLQMLKHRCKLWSPVWQPCCGCNSKNQQSPELKCDPTPNSLGPLTWLLCCFQPYYSLYKQFSFFTVIQPNSSVRQSEVLGKVSKLCRWRAYDTTEVTLSVSNRSSPLTAPWCGGERPKLSPPRNTQIGPLKGRCARGHCCRSAQTYLCADAPHARSAHTQIQNKRRGLTVSIKADSLEIEPSDWWGRPGSIQNRLTDREI